MRKETTELLERMERCSLLPSRWNEEEIMSNLRKIYEMVVIPFPSKITFCKDIFDERFAIAIARSRSRASANAKASENASESANEKASASERASASAKASESARARANESASASESASDYDFDWFCGEVELGSKGNSKYIEIMEYLLRAKEAGLGYLIDTEIGGELFVAPNPVIKIENNRFHSELCPAVEYATEKFYFLHGIEFLETEWRKIVSREITGKEALEIQSADKRAIALQYIGGERLMRDFHGKVVGQDEYGELIELTDFQDTIGKPYKYLKALDPDKGSFVWLRTHPDMKTPAEAEAWSYDLSRWAMKYAPSSRT